MTNNLGRAALIVATLLVAGTNGFVAPSASKAVTREIYSSKSPKSTGWDSFANLPTIKDISYGEESRKYRRTVYTHDDWKKHRSPDRFIYYIGAIFKSGVYKNLRREVTATTAIATLVCIWNCFTKEYLDLESVKHAGLFAQTLLPVLGMPLAPFTLASPSLGLLLGTS